MQSKNKPSPRKAEAAHIRRVAELPCSVCDAPGPSEVHEIVQGQWFLSVALCASCHRDGELGLHGRKTMWKIHKLDEMGALNITLRRILENHQ